MSSWYKSWQQALMDSGGNLRDARKLYWLTYRKPPITADEFKQIYGKKSLD